MNAGKLKINRDPFYSEENAGLFIPLNIKQLGILLIAFLFALNTNSQTISMVNDTLHNQREQFTFRKQIVPISFISAALIMESFNIKEEIQNSMPKTKTTLDNYIQYAPIIILYSSDILYVNHMNTTFNQTKYLIISELATSLIVLGLNNITGVARPNGSPYSFPSGHTSYSFVSATVLYKEFNQFSKPLAYSGYLFSSATATLRVTNNKHWVPDVLAGAGIAILVTNLVYYFEPLKNWDPFKGTNKVSVLPEIDPENNYYSLRISLSL